MACIVGRMACGCGQSPLLCVPFWRASFSPSLSCVLIDEELNATQLQMRIPLISVSRIHKLQRRQCNVPVSLAKLLQRAISPLNALANVFPATGVVLLLASGWIFSTVVMYWTSHCPRGDSRHCIQTGRRIPLTPVFFKSTLWTSWPRQKLEPKCPPCEM